MDNQHNYRSERDKLAQLEKARKAWVESEKILNILRTQSAKPLKEPTDQEILAWHQTNLNSSPLSAS